MARFEVYRLKPKQRQQIRDELTEILSLPKNKQEMDKVCRALFSDSESAMFLRRIQVAILLSKGWNDREIMEQLGVSPNQIHRVKVAIIAGSEGFELIIKRLKKNLLQWRRKSSSDKDRRPPYWTMAYWLTLGGK